MKQRITLSLVLILSVLLPPVSLPVTAQTQQPRRFFAWDTGVVSLGPNQTLRVTINAGDGDDAITVRFRGMEYTQDNCNSDDVCKLSVASQSTSAPITLMPGEAASHGPLVDTSPIWHRVMVISNSRNVRVNAQIIDDATGQITSIIAILIAL